MELLIILLWACAADGLMELGSLYFTIVSIIVIAIVYFLIWYRGLLK